MAHRPQTSWETTVRQREMHRGSRHTLKTAGTNALFGVVAIYFLLPIVWLMFSMTKSTHQLFALGLFTLPHDWHLLYNLKWLSTYEGSIYWRWFLNSVGYSTIVAGFGTLFAAMFGFALAKYRFRGRRAMFSAVLAGLMVPAAVLTIPIFLMESTFGLLNSYQGVILPMLVSPFAVYFMNVYIDGAVPIEILEAGRVDGASDLFIFFRIVIPMIVPGLVTLILINFVGSWNNFFLPLVLLSNSKLFPLTLGLDNWIGNLNAIGHPPLYPIVIMGSFLSIFPMLILFPILRRYINIGLTAGSVKG